MKIVVGLGNPGSQYKETRHNIGFQVVDELVRRWNAGAWKKKFEAEVSEHRAIGPVLLIKPQTYMNLSGDSVAAALHWYKIEPKQALVLSDDIDLKAGTVRVRPHGGAGTHNGWRSIIAVTGSDRFPRIRIGVGAPPPQWELSDWVLSGFGESQSIMDEAFKLAAQAADCFVRHGIDLAMNRYNKREHAAKDI